MHVLIASIDQVGTDNRIGGILAVPSLRQQVAWPLAAAPLAHLQEVHSARPWRSEAQLFEAALAELLLLPWLWRCREYRTALAQTHIHARTLAMFFY